MASIFDNLGQGLQDAGSILSPDVAQRQAQQRQLILRSQLATAMQNRQLAARAIIAGVQSGSIDPKLGQAKLAQLGLGNVPVGPSLEAQGNAAFIKALGGGGMNPSTGFGAPTPSPGQSNPNAGSAAPTVPQIPVLPPAAMLSPAAGRYIQYAEAQRNLNKPQISYDSKRDRVVQIYPDGHINTVDLGGGAFVESGFGKELIDSGVKPNSPEWNAAWKKRIAKETAPTQTQINVQTGGKPPTGYRWSQTKPGELEPIPGGPAAAGNVTDEAARFAVEQYFAGDKQALMGLARNKEAKAKVMNLIPVVAKEQGLNPKDVALAQAEYQGMVQGERTLGQRKAQIEMAGSVLKQFIPIAVSASDAYKRSGIKSINDLQNSVAAGTASPEHRRLNGAVNAVINAYGRAINPTGVASDSDKAEARKILDAGFSSGDFRAAANQIMTEINAELKAPGQVKQGMGEFFKGKGESPKEAPKKLTYDPTTGTFK